MNRWSHAIGVFLRAGQLGRSHETLYGGVHLRAGSLPKKATNVMKEMTSTMSAMVVTVSMVSEDRVSLLPSSVPTKREQNCE